MAASPEWQPYDGGGLVAGQHQPARVDHPADVGERDRAQLGMVDRAADLAGTPPVVTDQVGAEGWWRSVRVLEAEAGEATLHLAEVVDPGDRLLARIAALVEVDM